MKKITITILLFFLSLSFVSGLGTYPESTNDTILYFHFNNVSSVGENQNRTYDWSPLNLNNGTNYNAPYWNPNGGFLQDGAYELDGNDDFIQVLDTDSLSPSNYPGYTFMLWLYMNEDYKTNGGSGQYIFAKGSSGNYEYQLQRTNKSSAPGDIIFTYFVLNGSSAKSMTLLTNYKFNTWYHVVITMNSTDMYGYIDGKRVSTNTVPDIGNGASPLQIGNRLTTVRFNGTIDDFRLSTIKLSDDDVQKVYSEYYCGQANKSSDMLAHYQFENSSVPFVCDLSGNSRYASIVNRVYYDNTTRLSNNTMFLNGTLFYNSTASSYQGNDSYIEINSSSLSFDVNTNLTINFWMNPHYSIPIQPTDNVGVLSTVQFQFGGVISSGDFFNYGTRNGSSLSEVRCSISQDQWQMITMIYNSSDGQMYLYKNGVFQSNNTAQFFNTSNMIWRIGSNTYSANKQNYNGWIDDFRIYNRTLDVSDIDSLYTTLAPPYILINNPISRYYTDSSSLGVDYSISGNYIDSCWLSIDGGLTKIMLPSCENATLNLTDIGRFNLTVYSNDTRGVGDSSTTKSVVYYGIESCDGNKTIGNVFVSYDRCNVTVRNKYIGQFDGLTSNINFGTDEFLTPPNLDHYTSFYIKPEKLNGSTQYVYSKFGGLQGFGTYIDNRNLSNLVGFYYLDNGTEKGAQTPIASLSLGVWSHIIITYVDGRYSTYFNGELSQGALSGGNMTDSPSSSFTIGKRGSNTFEGELANLNTRLGRLSSWEARELYLYENGGIRSDRFVPILYGHNYDEENSNPTGALSINTTQWLYLLNYLNDSGYSTITYQDYYDYRTGIKTIPERSVIINFDDVSANDWVLMANISSVFGYIANVNLVTSLCDANCWTNISILNNTYHWYVSSHGETHCHFGSGTGGTNPVWCNTTESRAGNFSKAKQDIYDHLGYYPIAHAFPWNDYGVSIEEKNIVMTQCAEYFGICFGSGTILPSLTIGADTTNLTDGSMRRTSFEGNVLIEGSLKGLNSTIRNFKTDVSIFDLPFTQEATDISLNHFVGTSTNVSYSTDKYIEIENIDINETNNVSVYNLSNAVIFYSTGIVLSPNFTGDSEFLIAPNTILYIYDSYNSTSSPLILNVTDKFTINNCRATLTDAAYNASTFSFDYLGYYEYEDNSTRGIRDNVLRSNVQAVSSMSFTSRMFPILTLVIVIIFLFGIIYAFNIPAFGRNGPL